MTYPNILGIQEPADYNSYGPEIKERAMGDLHINWYRVKTMSTDFETFIYNKTGKSKVLAVSSRTK